MGAYKYYWVAYIINNINIHNPVHHHYMTITIQYANNDSSNHLSF